ncbi:MAG TPA: BrnT family toxin [Alphaproteobacteria bacterium]|nr:BrnT family toxin [Alphaproteobacteria bacterium]
MLFEWDEAKRKRNLAKHGVDFECIDDFDWVHATIRLDSRQDYGEDRYVATGYLGERLHICVWTIRENIIRLISLRKANGKEERIHEEEAEALDE